ncbi:DUF2240 family protein [Thermococcus barophilus]|uniref:DUF2240 family protein n=2 Tax=Thermococcus barophilus TaxID=55802 RepID=A0A0S1XDE2_THEBA|nr:DUF2240 family protein [Thermococcus barophilus]ADT84613.1 hypothetical protein TERMP_01638 [Thermococcus barophilus MP]ALM75835.1 hypothetical protein TBCH5v1_1930 [Thermococcus barophilus]
MKELKNAILYKGSNEFTKQELIGILVVKLRLMSVKEAKELIEGSIERGIIEERDGKLIINEEILEKEEKEEDIFTKMIAYIARKLGWSEFEVLEDIKKFSERYGTLDKRIVAYLYGVDKGIDMSKFKDKLEV